MSRYRYSDGDPAIYRLPVTLEATAGGTINFTISLTNLADVDLLWTASQVNGYDIRVVQPDGRTLITPTAWDIQSWDQSARTGVIRVQGYAATAGMGLLWLVWGKEDGDATSTWVGTPVPSSPKTTYVHRADPSKLDPARVFTGENRSQAAATRPRGILRKNASEVLRIYFRIDALRRSRWAESLKDDDFDAPIVGSHDVVASNGSDESSMYTSTDGRFALDSAGKLYYSLLIKAGTTGNKYTARVTLTTNEGETIMYRGGVAVTDVLAS